MDLNINKIRALLNKLSVEDLEQLNTEIAERFKGNHKKGNPDWKAPRNSGKSGHRGKEVHYRGNSHEQTCISTVLDRNGRIALVPACNGRLTTHKGDYPLTSV